VSAGRRRVGCTIALLLAVLWTAPSGRAKGPAGVPEGGAQAPAQGVRSTPAATPPAPPDPAAPTPVLDEEPEAAEGDVASGIEEGTLVRYHDDRLTVALADAALGTVLREIGRQSGARIRIDGIADRQVSLSFERLRLDEGLRRLLDHENFTLIYTEQRGPDGRVLRTRLKELQVFGTHSAAPAAPAGAVTPGAALPAVPSASVATNAASALGEMSQLFQKYQAIPLPPGGALATALGADTATFQSLLETAMRSDQMAHRAEAARLLEGVLDSDAEARQSLTRAIGGMDAAALAGLVRASAGDHGEEMVRHLASNLRTPELRFKANEVLLRLRRAEP
jgi:hypothetical protein